MWRAVFIFASAFFGMSGCAARDESADVIEARTQDYRADFVEATEKLLSESDTPGVAVAIVRKDGRRWMHGFGFADLEKQQPMSANTVISIGSVSKTVTAVAAAMAAEDGLIDLDHDINLYLPFEVKHPNFPEAQITMRHLLTHTAGVSDNAAIYKSKAVYHWGGDSPITLEEFSRDYFLPEGAYFDANKNFTKLPPGGGYDYSNVGFALAGLVIEQATAEYFHEFTKEKIFDPLGMENTGWLYSGVDKAALGKQYGIAAKHGSDETMAGAVVGKWRAYKPYGLTTYPDGGLRTSVADLSRFLIAVMNEGAYDGVRILDPASTAGLFAPQRFGHDRIPNIRGVQDQALGFVYEVPASIDQSSVFIGHNGGDPGTNTFMYFSPDTDIGVIYFTNADVYSAAHIHAIQTIVRSMIVNNALFFD